MTPGEWIKANATLKEGTNLNEFETLVSDLDPLKNIKSKEDALNFIDRNTFFKSGLDSAVSRAVSSHDEKFTSEKLPELIKAQREAWVKEANPTETPEQKKIRELEDWKKESLNKETKYQLKDALTKKANELDYSVDVERFVIYGDKALDQLTAEHSERQSYVKTEIERITKEKYGNNTPPSGGGRTGTNTMKRSNFDALSDMDKRDFIKNSGFVTD